MRARRWMAYGAFAAVSMMFGVVLTAAVFLPRPLVVVAGLLGLGTAVATARRERAGAFVGAASRYLRPGWRSDGFGGSPGEWRLVIDRCYAHAYYADGRLGERSRRYAERGGCERRSMPVVVRVRDLARAWKPPDYGDSSARRDHQASAAVIALSAW
jgi:hypothetical protein